MLDSEWLTHPGLWFILFSLIIGIAIRFIMKGEEEYAFYIVIATWAYASMVGWLPYWIFYAIAFGGTLMFTFKFITPLFTRTGGVK